MLRVRIALSLILTATLLFAEPATQTAMATENALTVQVRRGEETVATAYYTLSDLQAMPQTELMYSSLDGANAPVMFLAQGIVLHDFLQHLGITEQEVERLNFTSSDGWSRVFPASSYLQQTRYRFPAVVDGYERESATAPEFAVGTAEYKETIQPMLALLSYAGRFEANPASNQLSDADGIRFCYGQEQITDTVLLGYGRDINRMVIVLSISSTFVATLMPEGSGTAPPEEETSQGSDEQANLPPPQREEIERPGLMADSLTITVGYFGGHYYTKKVFSYEELTALPQVQQVYSYIDSMPAVCLTSAVGVRLMDILDAAGIDAASIHSFHFYCADVARTWYVSLQKYYLLDTARYYYPNLPFYWDYDEAEPLAGGTEGAIRVETILALKDRWRRFATAEDFTDLTSSTRFRLVFGQTDNRTPTGSLSAKWVHTVAVTLIGTPPAGITLDVSALELEVGSEYQLEATLTITDNTTDQRVIWNSSAPAIVSVDSRGRIKVIAEGESVITVTTEVGGLSASVAVRSLMEAEKVEEATLAPAKPEAPAAPIQTTPAEISSSPDQTSSGVYEITESADAAAKTVANLAESPRSRVYEISKTPIALAEIDFGPNPLAGATAAAAGFLLCCGASAQILLYRKKL